jgi:hypothetical protein
MKILTAVALMVVLGGCAASTRPAPSAGAQTFAGEVWTWDDKESTVMLIQEDGRPVRVKTTPDQMRTLRLHSFSRITGTPAPPADVVIMTGTSGPVTAVPKAPAEIVELKGAVAAVGPGGRLVVNSDRGPVHVWVAPGPEQRFKVGDPVSVSASVQPVDLGGLPEQRARRPRGGHGPRHGDQSGRYPRGRVTHRPHPGDRERRQPVQGRGRRPGPHHGGLGSLKTFPGRSGYDTRRAPGRRPCCLTTTRTPRSAHR